MKKQELEMALRSWRNEATQKCNLFSTRRYELGLELHDHNITILTSFMTSTIRSLTDQEVEGFKRGDYGQVFGEYEFEKIRSMPSYGSTNPLAVLRVHYRKIKRIKKRFNEERMMIKNLLGRLKELDHAVMELQKTDLSDELFDMQFNIEAHRELVKHCLSESLSGADADFWPFISALFIGGRKLKLDDLLQVITPTKSKKHWDGEKVTAFAQRLAELPEELDFEAFERLIFLDRLEDFYDSYLSDIYQEHMFNMMDRYEAETGQRLIDPIQILEDIAGKPIQTFTAKMDEYGDIVSLEPNKPNLKLVKEATSG